MQHITSASSLSVSTTSNLAADVTTSGAQQYDGAVTLSADNTLTTTTDSNATFGSTIDSDDASTKRDLTLTLGSGSASVTGIVGATSLDVLTLNSSSSFTAAVTATSIVNAASKTATFSDNVTANITNSGTLLFDTSADKSVTGTIAEPGDGATGTEIKVIDSADGAPATVTFTATIAADTLTVGTSSKAGAALFEDDVTVPTINITGGDVDAEDSTVTFNTAVTSSSGITLDDNTGDAKVIFDQNNTVNIASTIDGGADNEGTIQVTGATKTFKSAIGSTSVGTLNIDATPVFESTVEATTIDIAGSVTATFNDAITATTIALNGSSTLTISYTGAITVAGNITDTSTSNEINVLFATADTAPALVTFSGAAVAADTINIGSNGTKGANVLFSGSTGVTATNLRLYSGNHIDEDTTVTFNDDLTVGTLYFDDYWDTPAGETKAIFATNNDATISGNIRGSNAANEGTIQVTGSTKTFTGTIGNTVGINLYDIDGTAIFEGSISSNLCCGGSSTIDIDGTATFNSSVLVTSIDNDGTATFKSDVTAATANDGTLTLTPNGDNNITHTGAISGAGTLNAVEADDGAVNSVTFSTTVAAATFNVGSTSKSGVVILNGDTTVTNLNIYAGNVDAEDSTVTVNGDLDTTTITLDDGTNSAVTKIIFADSDTVTITGAITAATANDGTIQVTGANKTFSGTIGGTRIGTLDIDETSTYTGAVTVDNLDIAAK